MPSLKRKIVRKSIPDALVDDLRERILNGEFSEGSQIRQEMLADEYNVSRMPVREALRRLETEGLVEFHTHRGAVVMRHSLEEIGEMFDLRTLLEVEAVRYAIPNLTQWHIAQTEAIIQKLEQAYQDMDIKAWGGLNTKFHASLYEAANRPHTKSLIQNTSIKTERYIRLQLILTGQLKAAEEEHRELFELFKARKIDEASELLKNHIQTAKKGLLIAVAEYRENAQG